MSTEVLEFDALLQLLEEQGAPALIADLEASRDADAQEIAAALSGLDTQRGALPLDAGMLATQLIGQLGASRSPALMALVSEARSFDGAPWLEPTGGFISKEPSPLAELTGHTNFVGGLVVLPDNRTLVSSSEDGSIRVWDMETGEQLHQLDAHRAAVNYLALTPDGTRLLSAGDDHVVRVWDVSDWSVLHVLRGHTGYVSKVVATAQERAVSVSADQSVRVWDLVTGESIARFDGHNAWVFAVAVSPDGASAVTASLNHTMIQWDLRGTPSRQRTILGDGNADVHMIMGDIYLGGSNDTGRGHKDGPTGMVWSRDGRKLVSVSNDVIVWDMGDLSEVARFTDHAWSIKGVALFGDDRKIAVGEHCIKLWDLDSNQLISSWSGHDGAQIYALTISPDAQRLITGDQKGKIKVWDLPAVQRHEAAGGHSDRVYPMSFSPDRARLLSSSSDRSAMIWDVESNTPLRKLGGHEDIFVYGRGWIDGGRAVLTACRGALRVWDAETGELRRTIRPPLREGMSYDPRQGYDFIGVCATQDGRRAVCGSVGNKLTRVDLISGEMEFFEAYTAFCQEIVLSADERYALTMSYYDGNAYGDDTEERPGADRQMCPVQLWDIDRLELERSYFPEVSAASGERDTDYPCSVSFSADEERVIAGGARGTIRAWDKETGELLVEHKLACGGYPNRLRWNEAGELETVTIKDGVAHHYRFSPDCGELLEHREVLSSGVKRSAWSADGGILALTQADQLVSLIEVESGRVLCHAVMMVEISELELSEDGALLAVGDIQGQVHVLRVRR
jgi:WD40 repeat protein